MRRPTYSTRPPAAMSINPPTITSSVPVIAAHISAPASRLLPPLWGHVKGTAHRYRSRAPTHHDLPRPRPDDLPRPRPRSDDLDLPRPRSARPQADHKPIRPIPHPTRRQLTTKATWCVIPNHFGSQYPWRVAYLGFGSQVRIVCEMKRGIAKAAESRLREIEAINLRRQGLTYGEIAERVGYSDHTGARLAVLRGMQRALQEPADELREIEANRLDALQSAYWRPALEGDAKAATILLKLMERRSKLLGLDQPIRVESNVTVFEGGSELDAEVQRLAEFLASNANTDSGSVEVALAIEAGSSRADES